MKSIRILVCCLTLLLALGAAAVQNPANPPAPSGQPQATPPPSGQPQTAPPSAPQEQSPQGAPRTMQPPTIDDQVKALSQELSLNPGQEAKTKDILQDQRSQAMTIVNDGSVSREDKILKLQTLREGTIAKVRALLNDDQKKKLDQMLQVDEQGGPPPKRDQQANPPPQPSPSPK